MIQMLNFIHLDNRTVFQYHYPIHIDRGIKSMNILQFQKPVRFKRTGVRVRKFLKQSMNNFAVSLNEFSANIRIADGPDDSISFNDLQIGE